MSERHSHSSRPRRRHDRHVRFSLPLQPEAQMTQPSISRAGTPRLREQPTLSALGGRRLSMSDVRPHHERLLRAHEALHDMRFFLEGACNFHGEEKRRALTVPSVNALCSLVSFVNALRGGANAGITRRFEMTLRHANVDLTKRHPHVQLAIPDTSYMSVYERNARHGDKLRMCREASWRLAEFVSRQLQIPIDVVRSLPEPQLEQRELDALKERLRRFNVPRSPPGVIRNEAGGTNSVPQSPVERHYADPRPPGTDPPQYMRRAYPNGLDEDFFRQMGDLNLPAAVHGAGTASGSTYGLGPSLAHSAHARVHPQHSVHPGSNSPHEGPAPSPYASATTYTPSHVPTSYTASNPPRTPPQTYAQSPFTYGTTHPGSHPNATSGYSRTPPRNPAGYPGSTYMHGSSHASGYGSPSSNYPPVPQTWQAPGLSHPPPASSHPDYANGGRPGQPTPYPYPQAASTNPGGQGGAGHSPYHVPRRY